MYKKFDITTLTPEHLNLAVKVEEWNKAHYWMKTSPKKAIAYFLAEQFQASAKDFDMLAWMKACGLYGGKDEATDA
jgi:hypothetical protein